MDNVEFRSDVEVELIDSNATDLQVARAAWVSTKGVDAREAEGDRIPGLINFLMRDRHGSPFEHNTFTFLIRCPIFVVREFHRHRAGWSYNEESGRYTQLKPIFYVPDQDRKMVQAGKPGAYVFEKGSVSQSMHAVQTIKMTSRAAYRQYSQLLDYGIAKEVARMTLPLNIFTSFYATCNSRSLMHFLSLRTEHEDATYVSHPQWEIQLVANKMEEYLKQLMPYTYESYVNNGRVAP